MIRIKFKGYVLSLAAPPDLYFLQQAGRTSRSALPHVIPEDQAFGPASTISFGIFGYFLAKFSWNMPASFFAVAS